MDAVHAENILSWILQVTLIASAGALLGAAVRMRHARARLVYCHTVMAAAILLPALQPVQRALMLTTGSAPQGPVPPGTPSEVSWTTLLLLMLAGGSIARFGWFVLAFAQLRRLRRLSVPFARMPGSLLEARRLTGADASFRLCDPLVSPAAVGHVDPVILFPRAFAAMSEQAQQAIAVHELLHVKRNDWLRTVIEQSLTVVFWFNPGVWWLVAEARLCREEMVDADVVALTAERAHYVDALLAFTRVKPSLTPLPAARFFSKRQLTRRMEAIVRPQGGSLGTLVVSYSVRMGVVVCCALLSFVLFPVQGRTEVLATRAALLAPPVMFFMPATTVDVVARRRAVPPAPPSFSPGALPANWDTPPHNVIFKLHRLHLDEFADPRPQFPVPPAFEAIRAIRPGDVVPPAEIGLLLAKVPPGQTIEIIQDENNTITRVVMGRAAIRRASNEIDVDVFTFDVPVGAVRDDAATAVPAEPADGID